MTDLYGEDQLAAFNATFASIQAGYANAEEKPLFLHMWESFAGAGNSPEAAAIQARKGEIASFLGVMAGKEEATYTDKGYFDDPENSQAKDAFRTRAQTGDKEHGLVGIASSTVVEGLALPVYPYASQTGILFEGATPILSLPYDAWSTYYQKEDGVPNKAQWEASIKLLESYEETAEAIAAMGQSYFKDHPDEAKKLAGVVAMLRARPDHPLHHLVSEQVNFEEGKPYATVDPLDPEVQERAMAAYKKLIAALKENPQILEEFPFYPEIVVNTKLEQARAILAYNAAEEAQDFIPYDPSRSLSENLQGNPELTKTLFRAIAEQAQLAEAQREAGMGNANPTIVIYQPQSKEHSMVHVPPKLVMKQVVNEAMRQQNLMPDNSPSHTP